MLHSKFVLTLKIQWIGNQVIFVSKIYYEVSLHLGLIKNFEMHKFFNRSKSIFVLIALVVGGSAVKYQCSFTNRKVWFANDIFYGCDIKSGQIERMNQKNITSISGNHLNGCSNRNVRSISISQPKTFYMPRGLEKFFSDLVLIVIHNVGLLEVHQEDMQPFYFLKFLSFAGNSIKYLEQNLFTNNPYLEVILLHKNQIKSVGRAFENLTNIRRLNFDGNECFSGNEKNKNRIGRLITSIYETCKLSSEDVQYFNNF